MDTEDRHLIYSFPKGKGEEIQLAVRKFKGKHYIDVRQWYQDKTGNLLLPTRKGVFFSLEYTAELKKAVERLSKLAERLLTQKDEETKT